MPTHDVLEYATQGPWVTPRYLLERDDTWLRELLEVQNDCVGLIASEADALLGACAARLVRAGARARAVATARAVLERAYARTERTTIKPRDVRRALYTAGARGELHERDAVIARIAADFSIQPERVLAAAFGDFPEQKIVTAPERPFEVGSFREMTNLDLLTAFLHCAQGIEVKVREHVRAVVRFAKLKRLLCTFDIADDRDGAATLVRVSGPLALFRPTTKYGAALAAFVPQVAATRRWELRARCSIDGRALQLRATAADPIHRGFALPRAYDSKLERRLARDLRRLRSAWTISREAAALRTPAGLVFPDFSLVRDDQIVHVEVVGFWTADYLAHKRRTLAAVAAPLVVCVDAAKRLPEGAFGDKPVLTFHEHVDARKLLDACESVGRRNAGASGRSLSPTRSEPNPNR